MSIAADLQLSCDQRHKDVITKSSLLNWIVGSAFVIGGVIFNAAITYQRVESIGIEVERSRMEITELRDSRNSLEVRLATLQNDVAWTNQTLELVANKLSVSVPKKGR